MFSFGVFFGQWLIDDQSTSNTKVDPDLKVYKRTTARFLCCGIFAKHRKSTILLIVVLLN